MQRRLILLLLMMGFYGMAIAGQTFIQISGEVKDTGGEPLPAANIILLKDSSIVKVGLSGSDGRFIINGITPSTYRIRFEFIGFETQVKELPELNADYQLPTIVMQESATDLKEVTVKAHRPLLEVKPDMLVVNVDQSIAGAGSSALDVLQRSPGVQIDNNDNISLKGKSGVMIWIDGKPTPMTGADLANVLRSMPSHTIDKIELISNPGARYDAAGSAGIINIRTKKDQRFGTNGTINASYGQGVYPKYNAGFSLNHRHRKFNVYASYNYALRYWFNHLMLDRRFLDTDNNDQQLFRYAQDNYALFDFNNHTASGGFDYSLTDKTSIGLGINYVTNRFNPKADNVSRALGPANELIYNFVTQGRHENFYYNYSGNGFLRHRFDTAGRELTVDLDYARFGNDSRQHFITWYDAPEGNDHPEDYFLNSDLQGLTQIRSLKADFINPASRIPYELGIKTAWVTADNRPLFFEKHNGEFVPDPKRSNHFIYNENINAAYVNLRKDFRKWSTQIGLRAEQTRADWEQKTTQELFKTEYTQLFPSLAVQYHLHEKHDLGITVSRRIERPNYQQLNPFKYFIDRTTYREGYPYLRPASFYSTELSHTYKQRFVTTLTVGINDGVIVEVIQPSDYEDSVTVQTNKNLDRMIFIGLSGSYNFQITRWWSNMTNFNAYYARYEGYIANTPLRDGEPTIHLFTNNTFLLPRDFSVELGCWYQARQVYGYMVVEPLWMLNAGIQKHLFDKKATVRLNVQDAFWTGYPSATSRYVGYLEHFTAKRETRTVNIAFTYRFGSNSVAPTRRRSGGAEDEKRRAGTQS